MAKGLEIFQGDSFLLQFAQDIDALVLLVLDVVFRGRLADLQGLKNAISPFLGASFVPPACSSKKTILRITKGILVLGELLTSRRLERLRSHQQGNIVKA